MDITVFVNQSNLLFSNSIVQISTIRSVSLLHKRGAIATTLNVTSRQQVWINLKYKNNHYFPPAHLGLNSMWRSRSSPTFSSSTETALTSSKSEVNQSQTETRTAFPTDHLLLCSAVTSISSNYFPSSFA